MKKLLVIPFFLISLISSATVYYIDPAGKNTNNGSSGSPWNTLSYACTRVKAPGDIIHVKPGIYYESVKCILSVGVSIEGEGVTSTIVSSVSDANTFTIELVSSIAGTNGNQHISGIKMDGNKLKAFGAISVVKRSSVEIYNCTFVDFNHYGVGFNGGYDSFTPPATYATGNKFHDNKVINCSGYYPAGDKVNGEGKYALGVNAQEGMLIYNNLLDQTSRSPGSNGYLIKGVPGLNKGLKIYNNTIKKAPYDNLTWDFAIELWLCRGGVEIYGNTVTAGIDISGSTDVSGIVTQKGSYDYSVYIHNNIIGPESLSTSGNVVGIFFEQSTEYAIVEANHIKNVALGVYFPTYTNIDPISNIDIRYNLLENIGVADGGRSNSGWGIYFLHSRAGNPVNNVRIFNNTIIAHSGSSSTMWGIQVPDIGPVKNVAIRNNIVQDFDNSPVSAGGTGETSSVTIDQLSIENNIFYNNGNNNTPGFNGITPTNYTTRNNITSIPMFVSASDFHLQAGSPATGKGITISGVTTDLTGIAIRNPPSIGAYEASSAAPATAIPVYQNSVIENASPSTLAITYNLSLANIAPPVTAFKVLVNSLPRIVSAIAISSTKVLLTLSSGIVKGDVVKVSYTRPAASALQTASGGQAASFTSQTTINNVTTAPVATVTKIVMKIDPNPVHGILNALLTYTTPITAGSSEVLDIYDNSGNLLIEKLLNINTKNVMIPINLGKGIYIVQLLISGLEMASQRIIVY